MMERARVAQQPHCRRHHDDREKCAFTREAVWSFVFEIIFADLAKCMRISDAFAQLPLSATAV